MFLRTPVSIIDKAQELLPSITMPDADADKTDAMATLETQYAAVQERFISHISTHVKTARNVIELLRLFKESCCGLGAVMMRAERISQTLTPPAIKPRDAFFDAIIKDTPSKPEDTSFEMALSDLIKPRYTANNLADTAFETELYRVWADKEMLEVLPIMALVSDAGRVPARDTIHDALRHFNCADYLRKPTWAKKFPVLGYENPDLGEDDPYEDYIYVNDAFIKIFSDKLIKLYGDALDPKDPDYYDTYQIKSETLNRVLAYMTHDDGTTSCGFVYYFNRLMKVLGLYESKGSLNANDLNGIGPSSEYFLTRITHPTHEKTYELNKESLMYMLEVIEALNLGELYEHYEELFDSIYKLN
jgi:hypothetical protein